MSGHAWGPAAGTEGICEGCGITYIRNYKGQWWHSPQCYRRTSHWAYGATFNPTNRKAPPWEGDHREKGIRP